MLELTAILIGVLGWFVSIECINSGQIFSFYGRFLGWLSTKGQLGAWISNPLGLCHKCLAAWICVINFVRLDTFKDIQFFIYTLTLIALSGLTAIILKKTINE